ncbi:uncharacterized protein LOC134282290 [Saccostrea cucullata]|uniref:uncharacterized protein LOC134282290 n=1 Tax=Saccostrea cuccullata TaxID=36930 RepID=UPI002ED4EB3C
MADKSRRHEVVEYTLKKKHAVILPSCLTHEKNQCETYCQDCEIHICIQCLIGSHKKHGIIDINDILQKQRLEIDAHTKELENTILPKYKNINSSSNTTNFDKVLTTIKEQEDKIWKSVRETGEDSDKKTGKLKMLDEPVVLSTLQSPYGHPNIYFQMFGRFPELWKVQCVGRDMILTSGNDKTINQIDMTGSSLKTIHTNENVLALTTNSQHEPVFCLSNARQTNTDIYIYNKIKVNVLLSTVDWFHVGICYSANGNPLVSMRSMDRAQSRVVRYSGTTEIQSIQYDSLRKDLFSTSVTKAVLLTENRNGDICV